MLSIKSRQRGLLEKSRQFRRWLRYGLALPSGYVATLNGTGVKPGWRGIKRAPGAGFWTRWSGVGRILVEPAIPVQPAPPHCIQAGNPGAFPAGKTFPSAPAYVHWLPSVIYQGQHGAILDADRAIHTELGRGCWRTGFEREEGAGAFFQGEGHGPFVFEELFSLVAEDAAAAGVDGAVGWIAG